MTVTKEPGMGTKPRSRRHRWSRRVPRTSPSFPNAGASSGRLSWSSDCCGRSARRGVAREPSVGAWAREL